MQSSDTFNVLIVKLSSLGDVIQTIPVVHDILSYYPQAKIDWVVEEAFAPLLQSVKGLQRVIPIAQRRWNRLGLKQWFNKECRKEKRLFYLNLRAHKYDVVLDLQGLIKSGLVTRRAQLKPSQIRGTIALAKPPFRATYANRSESCGYEAPVRWCTQVHIPMPKRIHAIQRTRLLCAKALGYSVNVLNTPPEYAWDPFNETEHRFKPVLFENMPLNTEHPYVVLVHGSSRADNAWPIQEWQDLAKSLNKQGLAVLLPQSNDEELINAQQISSSCEQGVWIIQRSDLLSMAKLIAQSSGVIGLDTGLSHIAIALNKPCVHIFLHDRAWRAGPLEGALGKTHQRWIGGSSAPSAQAVFSQWLCSV